MDLVTKTKLKKVFKITGYSFLALIAALVIFAIYSAFFLPYKLMVKQGVNNFPELLELTQQSELKDDPYLTSEVLPDHPLYSALLAKQRSQTSNPLWEPLLEEKNADAMYWYAMNNMAGVNGRALSGTWLIQSAKLGNPYAALYLSGKNYECERNIPHLCEDRWADRALELFEERASQGDLKARYYLTREFGSWGSQADTDSLVEVIVDSAKKGYYRPLIDFINFYTEHYGWKDLEDKKKGLSLWIMAANNNYIPAINKALYMISNEDAFKDDEYYLAIQKKLYEKSFLIGARGGIINAMFREEEKLELDPDNSTARKLMNRYNCTAEILTSKFKPCYFIKGEERDVALEEAKLLISKMKPSIFIDELHPDA